MTLPEIIERCSTGLWYLASPYSHPEKRVEFMRFVRVCKAAGDLMNGGVHVFSPIAHTHSIAEHGDLPTGFAFYEEYDLLMIDACAGVIVLMLPGWRESTGVGAEIKYAKSCGKTVLELEA